jgi:hypothetical protein
MRLRPGEGDDYDELDRTDDDHHDHHYDDHFDDKNYDDHNHNDPSPRRRQNMFRILPRQQLPFRSMQGKQIRVRGAAGEES